MQAPQERRGVDHLGQRIALQAPVVDLERETHAAKLELVQRYVPPEVRRGDARADPIGGTRAHPAQPFVGAPLHLKDMRHDMVCAHIVRLELERAACRALGSGVVAAFLEPEGMQRKDGVVRRVRRGPLRQHA